VPEASREVTFEEAEAAFHERRYELAAELFTLYTERKSENPWGYYMLGLSAWKADQNEIAKGAFERALELDPKHVKSRLNLSRVLLDVGKPDDALIQIRGALELDPESSVAYRLKGRMFDAIGQKPQAVESYRDAIRLDNNDAWSMNNLALIYIEEGLYAQALPPLARAVEIQSDNAIFLNNLGMALECNGHFRAAGEAYESAISVNSGYEKAVFNLARVQEVLEDPELEPADLETIARMFADEIAGPSEVVGREQESTEAEVAAGEQDESVDSEEDTESDGDGDSTDKEDEE
jgi:tetratricopeptide (TPR) repeat protein